MISLASNSRVAIVIGVLVAAVAVSTGPTEAAECHFQLGFAGFQAMIPNAVGECLEDEHYDIASSSSLQRTTHGLLVWRKVDSRVAFTDGYQTWVLGPRGFQTRFNSERFDWEAGNVSSTQPTGPSIALTNVPANGIRGVPMQGQVRGVDPASYHVAGVIRVAGGYWTKPTWDTPTVPLAPDGSFSLDVTTGGNDERADLLLVFLLPIQVEPPLLSGVSTLPADLTQKAVASAQVQRSPQVRTVHFSGEDWQVKTSLQPVGPGPTLFATDNVAVDDAGQLHLRLTQTSDGWAGAEVIGPRSYGYGTYAFVISPESPVTTLDPNVTLGLFTWSDNPANDHREIDVELARWGVSGPFDGLNAQFVVQPWQMSGHRHRFLISRPGRMTYAFTWKPGGVHFESRAVDGTLVEAWDVADAPPPGSETVHLNLWLDGGETPTNGKGAEVVVERFAFTPKD